MRRLGFTLIELLVVIAVIAALTAIAVPVSMRAKAHARRVICASNLRQVLLSFSIYDQTYEALPFGFCDKLLEDAGPPPPDNKYAGNLTRDKAGWWWFNYLQRTLKTDLKPGSVVWCPSRKVATAEIGNNLLCGNYGVNRSVCVNAQGLEKSPFVGEPVKTGQLRFPSKTLLIADSGYSLISWMAAADTGTTPFENPQRIDAFYIPGLDLNKTRPELAQNPDAMKGRHPGHTLNLGFTDGHLETRAAEFLACDAASFDSGRGPLLWTP